MENSNLFNFISKFNFNGVSFVNLKGYNSDKSENTENADVLINVGMSYKNMKDSDLKTLQSAKASELANENFGVALIEQAIAEKIQSIIAPNENRSKAQTEAYLVLNNSGSIKYCENTGSLVIFGTVVRKTVKTEGTFKEVKNKPLTLAKKHLDKVLNLKLAKVRTYKIDNVQSVKVNGDTIEFGN